MKKAIILSILTLIVYSYPSSAFTDITSIHHNNEFVKINKQAFKTNQKNMWDIKLTVTGSDKIVQNSSSVQADIVLVIDNSATMYYPNVRQAKKFAVSRLDNAKVAANAFVAQISSQRVAIVSYSSDAKILTPLTSDKTILYNAINNIEIDEATFMQAGIRTAAKILSESQNPYIVLLTDGVPTIRYIDNVVDFGNSISQCSEAEKYATIDEANSIKAKNIQFFTIGYAIDKLEQNEQLISREVLQSIQTKGYYEVNYTENGDTIIEIYKKIAGEIIGQAISPTIQNGYVIDPIGDMFSLNIGYDDMFDFNHYDVIPSKSEVTYDNETKTLRWIVGTLTGNTTATLTYRVTIKDEAISGVLYDTNKTTTLYYDDKNIDFPIPQVMIKKDSQAIKSPFTGDNNFNYLNIILLCLAFFIIRVMVSRYYNLKCGDKFCCTKITHHKS